MRNHKWLPWSDLMAFGLGRLKLSPNQFWQMSLREMDMAITGNLGKQANLNKPSRQELDAMLETYPDNTTGN